MNLLVIGSGAREHALVWKLKQSAMVGKIWCAPGNGGIAAHAECLPVDLNNVTAMADLAMKLQADLTIVGPEAPLVLGIVNEFVKRGLPILGPSQAAAQLEGSKVFAKQFMDRHRIPTAGLYGIYDSPIEALQSLDRVKWPLVIKADGLCAGKGVLVTSSKSEAEEFIETLLTKKEFGAAGERILLECGLAGDELSYIILTDGETFIPLAPTRDHKRAFDNDKGPNTGGMGAYSTDDILPPQLERLIVERIVTPTLQGLRADKLPYKGFLYFGLMLTPEGPQLLEYNCRLGDPETEVILLRADFDFAEVCLRASSGNFGTFQPKWSPAASICVVIASEGYPLSPSQVPKAIQLNESAHMGPGSAIFHAGTKTDGTVYYTNGGRLLVVAACGENLALARDVVYDAVTGIRIEGAFYRKDIGLAAATKSLSAVEVPKY